MSKTNRAVVGRAGQLQRAALGWLLLIVSLGPTAGCNAVSQGQNATGVRLYQQGQYQAATERFQQAITSDSRNPDGYYNLAATFHRLGKMSGSQPDLEQAERLYNQCLDHDPDHRDCHRALAVMLVEQGRSEEAFRLLEGWAQRSPSLAAPKIELARLWEEFDDKEAAKKHLTEALAIDPYDSRALAALGRLHEQSGDHAQALADYQRSLWHDRFQPEVAARLASLKAAFSPRPVVTPPDGTRTVVNGSPALR